MEGVQKGMNYNPIVYEWLRYGFLNRLFNDKLFVKNISRSIDFSQWPQFVVSKHLRILVKF